MKALFKYSSIVLISAVLLACLSRSKSDIAEKMLAGYVELIEAYKDDTGQYPSTAAGLTALKLNVDNVKNWGGPAYQSKSRPFGYAPSYAHFNDPWGRPFHYQSPGLHGPYDLYSYGADGLPGGTGEDRDITSWDIKSRKKK